MKQVREQLLHSGADDIPTSELLTFLLAGAGQKAEQLFPIISKLVTPTGIRRLRNMSVMQLCQTTGLDHIQAERLHALCVLTTRFAQYTTNPRPRLTTPLRALALLQPLMAHLDHEEFRVLVLDAHHRLVDNVLLYRATINGTLLRTAEVFRPAMLLNCPAVILCHNHPGGDPHMSEEDRTTTLHLVEVAKMLDLELVDHLIIGNPKCVSLRSLLNW